MRKVLVINGPNLNMLGLRPKEHYGSLTLNEINNLISEANNNEFELEFYQSNYEGDIITKIQENLNVFGIIINPGAYTHTSVAIHDALEMATAHKIEVHLSKVDDREDFRKINFVRDCCEKTFAGRHHESYVDAMNYLKSIK